ncbi:MAG: VCBS repeat-containing protein [Gemmatimonadales bacterium]|jgi:hypothetical protein
MEITITGIGTPQQKASVRGVSAAAVGAAASRTERGGPLRAPQGPLSARLQPLSTTTPYDGTVEIVGVSTASFTWGTRGSGGVRYVSATYQVRNATFDSVAYGDDRTNLTFLAVSTPSTLGGTAIATLKKFDGSDITTGLETQVLPTGWADLSGTAGFTSRAPDVLQAYTETEVGAVTPPADVTSIQPYAFIVRNPSSTSSRTLTANPGVSQFDGLVTFAFRVPLQATAADDPFTISMMVLPVDDNQVVITQSLEEADATSVASIGTRATALGASLRSLTSTTVGSSPATLMCTVRTAGTSGTPTGFLVDSIGITSESPNPYAATASHIDSTATLSATFGQTMNGATSATFAVNSFQGGRAFVSGSYTGAGTATLSAPAAHFWPGDAIEVALTAGLHGVSEGTRPCHPTVYRYRVAAAVASASFVADTGPLGPLSQPRPIRAGDINGDGKLDLLVANYAGGGAGSVTVFLGDGAGGFTEAIAKGSPFAVGRGPRGMVLADFNGDGKLDIATANYTDNTVSVRLGDGTGGFGAVKTYNTGSGPQDIQAGDVNGDGKLDLVIANNSDNTVTVLLGDGTGAFTPASGSPFTVGTGPYGVALGDVNGDGKLDIVTGNQTSNDATVLLGDGTGGFTQATGSPYSTGTTGSAPSAVALADVNGDGYLDLIVPNSGDNNVMVRLGDGHGAFGAASTWSVGATQSTPWAIAVGDMNGDGSVDLVVVNTNSNDVTVLVNDGTGNFTGSVYGSAVGVGHLPRGVTLGAFKNDGKLAIAVANLNDNTATVLLNP